MISGTVSPTDYLEAQRLHCARATKIAVVAGGAAALMGMSLYLATGWLPVLVLVGTGGGAIIGQLVMLYLILPRRVRRLHGQQADLASSFIYTWDIDAVHARGKSGTSMRPWNSYHKWKENDSIILLYHSDSLFEMLPKRWFKDDEQLDDFRRLLQSAKAK